MRYNGYFIQDCGDGTYDILEGDDLVDGEFVSIDDAKEYIDEYLV